MGDSHCEGLEPEFPNQYKIELEVEVKKENPSEITENQICHNGTDVNDEVTDINIAETFAGEGLGKNNKENKRLKLKPSHMKENSSNIVLVKDMLEGERKISKSY